MVSCEPTLRDTISPVLDDMAVIADEEESSTLGHVNLHANEAVCMSRQMVKSYPLTEVYGSIVEGLPVARLMSVDMMRLLTYGSFTDQASSNAGGRHQHLHRLLHSKMQTSTPCHEPRFQCPSGQGTGPVHQHDRGANGL